jgi:flagellar basal-body rod protein FlgC
MPIGPIGPGGPQLRPLFRSLGISASGLSAQRQRMDTIAENIANAETTRTDVGGPYRRRTVALVTGQPGPIPVQLQAGELPDGTAAGELPGIMQEGEAGVQVSEVLEDPTEGPMVYDPGHPDADANGYVRLPNVRVTDEMVDMMDARRAYEANASVFTALKGMLKRATEI